MKIEIRRTDDWIAVYKDGMKVEEGHSCSIERGLESLELPFTTVEVPYDPYSEVDSFPERLP